MCVCVHATEARTCNQEIDRVESTPLDVYDLENLNTVTVCLLIMSDP